MRRYKQISFLAKNLCSGHMCCSGGVINETTLLIALCGKTTSIIHHV